MQAYKGKYSEHYTGKDFLWTELIFKSEQDFIKALIKMDKFHVFSPGRYSNLAIRTTSRWSHVWELLLNTCKSTMYNLLYITSTKDLRLSPFNSKFLLSKLNAPCCICRLVVTWVVTSISNLWLESVSHKEFFCQSCSLNEALWEKTIALWQIEAF